MAKGKKYYPKITVPLTAHSDPGDATYTTLELTWPDGNNNATEMRLFMYFKSDGDNWWVNEMRTYDGTIPGDWIYYRNNYFSTPRGSMFTNSGEQIITQTNVDPSQATIFFKNFKLQAFVGPTVTPHPTDVETCPLKPQGDANCDNKVDMVDFEIWREEFIAETSKDADFNDDTKTDLVDFEAWREGFVARLLP